MRVYLVEVQAKVLLRSDADPDDVPENIYSRIAEFITTSDDVIDLDVAAYPLPEPDGAEASH